MSDCMIINTISVYPEAPVSFEILKKYSPQIIDKILEKEISEKYLLVDKDNKEIMRILDQHGEAIREAGVEIVETMVEDGFVYGNASAILNVMEGEKPIPSELNKESSVYSLEDLLELDEKLVLINSNGEEKEVYSFERKTKIREIVARCGLEEKFKGIYFGYPMGILAGREMLDEEIDLTTDYIYIFNQDNCALDRLVSISSRYEEESCGSCVFGYEGVSQINMILSDIKQNRGRSDDMELLSNLCKMMKEQSVCEIGIAGANTVLTAFASFGQEIEDHITRKVCAAAVCDRFISYHILPKLCVACNECQDSCQYDAILGKERFIHVIDQKECVQCGDCLDACSYDAIVRAGAEKPRGPRRPIPYRRN